MFFFIIPSLAIGHSCILYFQLWSARDYKPIKSLVGHESKVTSLDISGGEILLMIFFLPVYIIIQKPSLGVISSAPHLVLKI